MKTSSRSLHQKPKQLQLLKRDLRFFGGRLLHGRRRKHRPLSTKEAIHLTLRSSWAVGVNSFLQKRNKNKIESILRKEAQKYSIQIYELAIVSNHLHLVIRIWDRHRYLAFIRSISGQIARHVMQKQSFEIFRKSVLKKEWGDGRRTIKNRHPGESEIQGKDQQFWQFRPFTRILEWGRDFEQCCGYVIKNFREAMGFIKYTPRGPSPYARWFAKLEEGADRGDGVRRRVQSC